MLVPIEVMATTSGRAVVQYSATVQRLCADSSQCLSVVSMIKTGMPRTIINAMMKTTSSTGLSPMARILTFAPLTIKNSGMKKPYAAPLSLVSSSSSPSGMMAPMTKPAANAPKTMSRWKISEMARSRTRTSIVKRTIVWYVVLERVFTKCAILLPAAFAFLGINAMMTAMRANAPRMSSVCQLERVESRSAMATIGASSPQVP